MSKSEAIADAKKQSKINCDRRWIVQLGDGTYDSADLYGLRTWACGIRIVCAVYCGHQVDR